MARRFALGIDGGGTSTTVAVIGEGTVISTACGGSSNRNSVGVDAALAALHEALDAALVAAGASTDQVTSCCAALSGVDTPQDAAELLAALRPWFAPSCRLEVHNDAVAALCAGTGGLLDGIVLIAGTGTVAFGIRPDGRSARSAGWGGAFLDGGSAYDIGQRALAAVARSIDGRGPPTALLQPVCAACGIDAASDPMHGLLRWAYTGAASSSSNGEWARVGALARCVVDAASAGDAVAASVLDAAAGELVGSIEAVCRRLGLLDGTDSAAEGSGAGSTAGSGGAGAPVTVVLAGGLLHEGSALSERVERLCTERLQLCRVVHAGEPAVGAAQLAWQWVEERV